MGDLAVFVAGLGRCGSSLIMQMLERGEWPAYECRETITDGSAAWLRERAPGRAVKILDPQRFHPPRDLPAAVLWLDREPKQQADSIIKFSSLLGGVPSGGRAGRRRLVASLISDRPRALNALAAPGRPRLDISFEVLIERPADTAEAIADFLRLSGAGQLDAARAAAAVLPRASACYPGLLEIEILEGGRQEMTWEAADA